MERDRRKTFCDKLEDDCAEIDQAVEKARAASRLGDLYRVLSIWAEASARLERRQLVWATLFAAALGAGAAGGVLLHAGVAHTDVGCAIAGAVLLVACGPLAVMSAMRFVAIEKAIRRMRQSALSADRDVCRARGVKVEEPARGLTAAQVVFLVAMVITVWLFCAYVIAGGASQLEARLFSKF